ncbi:hypothetical protein [Streptomyces sp. DH8]|uniref:hypothetical protein n=1 Tax=Streptomyces sp. DH8 TaxID=2857008 RepID=UPI001E5B7586|nr:hypothetical protein [Streptomyces sp. DH8]
MKQNSIPIPQLGAATALVQLLSEYPTLPRATWYVDGVALHGHLHDAGFEELGMYAARLGGSIRPQDEFELRGEMVRSHYLRTTWRDVPVEIVVLVPVAADAAVAA